MHSLRGKRGLIGGLMFALAAAVALPVTAHAGPDPEAKRPNTGRYRLFAGNLGAITINRLYYGLNTRGEVGVDSLNSSTIGGGFWPKGTGNQYMFNSGLQVAGIIAGGAENPWAGDTTGGMFFDASGLRQHGTAVTELYNSVSPIDQANWPQGAYVPQGDASEEIFDDLLRGRLSASQGDVWFMASEADPGLNAARPHPLGIVAEYRVMGWNFPSGNEDLLYLVITFYNITTTNAAAYAQYRPGIRELLIEQANQFHALNNAQFNVDLPDDGYTIDPFYAAFAADPDVTASGSGTNFSSVNLPFAMGYAYHPDFPRAAGWTFAPNIFGAPFFAGAGFVGIKYLKSATGPGEIALFSNTQNGGNNFPDPNSAVRLYKYLSGTVTPADGVNCNQGDVVVNRICYIKNDAPADVRLLQSSSPIALEAGQSASIVVSYIHAAPVQIPNFVAGTAQRVFPGDPVRLSNATLLAQGANRVDSIMGFRGYSDLNSDGIVQQGEFQTVPGSLLRKALVAQAVFDKKFLLPFAPDAPEFFLIPGDGTVTVMWRPSATETTGDPYFSVAKDAAVVPAGGGAPEPNALYDANYRQFDVEGYRIYRGRADTPTGLQLIAQYDYAGTRFNDFTGQVINDARGSRCAPELNLTTSCAGVFDAPAPGVTLTRNVAYDLNGSFVQVQLGNRTLLASGDVINLVTDTAVTGSNTGLPELSNTGVPFVYVDNEPRNGLTYFYAVTAFDVNSITSTGAGFTSLESARISKRVVPGTRASNFVNDGTVTLDGLYGRGVKLEDATAPTIDPVTGTFSKKAQPSNALTGAVTGLVTAVLQGEGTITARLDSIRLGDPETGNVAHVYYYGVGDDAGRTTVAITIDNNETQGPVVVGSAGWAAGSADPDLAAQYGGGEGFRSASGTLRQEMPGAYYTTVYGRGCVNSTTGAYPEFGPATRSCSYNGARWYSGANETVADPNKGNYGSFNRAATEPLPGFGVSNSGTLDGVVGIYQTISYENMATGVRRLEAANSGAQGAGDFRVYWGAGGAVDSVIDLTHNVPVPFTGKVDGGWGIMNQAASAAGTGYDQRGAILTITDLSCAPGAKTNTAWQAIYACPAATNYALSSTAIPGPIAFHRNTQADARTRAALPNNGFVMWLKGYAFLFELAGGAVPAAGTEWTMRSYAGGIVGGNGAAGAFGEYSFNPIAQRQFSAIGAELVFRYDVTNQNIATTSETLAEVHTVPDPYYVTSALEATTTTKKINFVNLPSNATIRIYTTSGVLVRALVHETTTNGGELTWDVRNRNNQFVASGVYFYHVTAENGETTVGRMTIINYAQ